MSGGGRAQDWLRSVTSRRSEYKTRRSKRLLRFLVFIWPATGQPASLLSQNLAQMRCSRAPLVAALVAAVMVATGAVQETSFSCQDRPYGYYADVEAECQVFHICNNNAKWSFRCPNQTLFNQQYLVCDYQANVDCGVAASLYTINDNFGKVEEVEDDTESPVE
ncbi:uncharacterized protein LOC123505565 [Portunus trituberculatus]|uniref:uncharacterized protein LOC123505565 n=1 Tax=Portunus trituberculatus TaxID=210409 RepID=UPI001E1CDBA3|nr:uncharacterized protein LOC123505565 [Portunus trituberculatus]